MFEWSTFSYHARTAKERLLGLCMLPQLGLFTTISCEMESFQDVNLLSRIHLWFMHYVAQTHFLLATRTSWNNVFPKQRRGRGGIRAWPASSPDLNPVDFIFGDIQDLPFMLQMSVTYSTRDNE
jgi:hypothetical protein